MTTINDMIGRDNDHFADGAGSRAPGDNVIYGSEEPQWLKFLKSDTGPGTVEDYLKHPMNWNGSIGVAQILRGLTGLVGNLKLAVVDILIGVIKMVTDRGRVNA